MRGNRRNEEEKRIRKKIDEETNEQLSKRDRSERKRITKEIREKKKNSEKRKE